MARSLRAGAKSTSPPAASAPRFRTAVVVADPHVGNFQRFGGEERDGLNERCRVAVAALNRAAVLATKRNAVLFVAGDVFEERRPAPAVIAAVQRVLARPGLGELGACVVAGNHDTVAPGDHATAPLWPVASVIADRAAVYPESGGYLCVPWTPEPALERLDRAFAEQEARGPSRAPVVVAHFGIFDSSFPSWLKGGAAAHVDDVRTRMLRAGARVLVSGDYHSHKEWSDERARIIQVGCLCPTGFDNAGADGYGSAIVVDPNAPLDQAVERVELAGARFLTFEPGAVDVNLLRRLREANCTPHCRVQYLPGCEADAERDAEVLRAAGFPCDAEPREGSGGAPDRAAVAVDSGLRVAIVSFAQSMSLPAGVGPDDVIERAWRYVGATSG